MSNFLINTDKKLKKIITELQSSKHLGVDTEFIRESTTTLFLPYYKYPPKNLFFVLMYWELKTELCLKKYY